MNTTDTKAAAPQSPADRITDIVIAVLLIITAVAALMVSMKFPGTGLATDIGSARFPLIYASVLIFLCALLLWQKRRAEPVKAAPNAPQGSEPEVTRPMRTVVGVALSVGCAVLISVLGYALSVTVYLVLMMRLLGMPKWWLNLALALAITGGLYAVFSLGLGVPLPVGAWFE